MIGTGRVCATSAISAPSVITISTPRRSAPSTISVGERAASAGSARCRSAAPGRARRSARGRDQRVLGPLDARASAPPMSRIVGRLSWKSKNSSGSICATTSESSETGDRLERGGGGAGRVVPARERGDEDRRAQLGRLSFPDQRVHRSSLAGRPPARRPTRLAVRRAAPRSARGSRRRPRSLPDRRPEVAELRPGQRFEGRYACVRKDRLTARNGSPYLSLELRDRTGTIPARVFREVDRVGRPLRARRRGRGPRQGGALRGELQAELDDVRRLEPGEFDPAEFLPVRLPLGRGARGLPRAPDPRGLRPGAARGRRGGARLRCRWRPSSAARRAPAAATTPTSAGCSSTRSRSGRWRRAVPAAPAPRLRPADGGGARSTTSARRASSPTAPSSASARRDGLLGHLAIGAEMIGAAAAALEPPRRLALTPLRAQPPRPRRRPRPRRGRLPPVRGPSPEALALYRLNALDAQVKGVLEHGLGRSSAGSATAQSSGPGRPPPIRRLRCAIWRACPASRRSRAARPALASDGGAGAARPGRRRAVAQAAPAPARGCAPGRAHPGRRP